MSYVVREMKEQQCVVCRVVRPGTMDEIKEDGVAGQHYLYVDCPVCGEQVGSVLGFEGWAKAIAPVPEEVEHAIIEAVRRARAGEPEPGDAKSSG